MKRIFVAMLLCGTLFSCKKDIPVNETSSLRGETAVRNALTNTDWVLTQTALIYSPVDIDNAVAEACKQDDVYRFTLSGSTDIVFGGNDCWANAPFPRPVSGSYGTWILQADGTVLKQTVMRDVPGFSKGEVIDWTVDFITAEKMRLKRTVAETGKTYIQMDTYTRK